MTSRINSFLRRDRSTKAMTTDGSFRAVIINATATALAGQKQHQLDAYSGFFLAQGLSVAAALAAFLKGEERISLQFSGDGAIRTLFAESLQVGETRGYIRLADDAAELIEGGKISESLGAGTLKVSKILYNRFEPIIGIAAMLPESVARTVSRYLTDSEQIPSAVAIDAAIGDDGMINFAGALIVQSMPGALHDDIEQVEESIVKMPALSSLAASGAQASDILQLALGRDFNITDSTPVDFFCRCTLERFKSILMTLGYGEIYSMKEQRHNELSCQYCNKHYYLSDNDYAELLTSLKAMEN